MNVVLVRDRQSHSRTMAVLLGKITTMSSVAWVANRCGHAIQAQTLAMTTLYRLLRTIMAIATGAVYNTNRRSNYKHWTNTHLLHVHYTSTNSEVTGDRTDAPWLFSLFDSFLAFRAMTMSLTSGRRRTVSQSTVGNGPPAPY